jgi:glycosyltransferase involved in cell wall biosynthesis
MSAGPKLSVLMITYNHEKVVAQAIDSVLDQDADFEFELVIGEDLSPDATRSIGQRYAESFPQKVKLLARETNLGAIPNFVQTYNSCSGEYIALLEGDDFWTDPRKLQKQVDFLDQHKDVSLCHHAVTLQFDTDPTNFQNVFRRPTDVYSTFDELLVQNFIATCSVVLRREQMEVLPDWFSGLNLGDWPLFILLAEKGKVAFLPDEMATYRIHEGGIWSDKNAKFKLQSIIEMYRRLNRHFEHRYDRRIRKQISKMYFELARHCARQNELNELSSYMDLSFREDLYPLLERPRELARLLIKRHGGTFARKK